MVLQELALACLLVRTVVSVRQEVQLTHPGFTHVGKSSSEVADRILRRPRGRHTRADVQVLPQVPRDPTFAQHEEVALVVDHECRVEKLLTLRDEEILGAQVGAADLLLEHVHQLRVERTAEREAMVEQHHPRVGGKKDWYPYRCVEEHHVVEVERQRPGERRVLAAELGARPPGSR